MLGAASFYAGLITAFAGGASLLRPVAFLGIRTRSQGALVLLAGFVVVILGWLLPASNGRIEVVQTRLDEFAPVYQFNEVHNIHVKAPGDRAYWAIKTVTADEILFFRTLTWIRRFGRRGRESILNAPERLPLLDVATQTSFLILAEEPGREIVVGTIVMAPPGVHLQGRATPEQFKALDRPGFAKAAMNFRVEETGPGTCVVTTETRVYSANAAAVRRFAAYWRVIYPGSALIRRMWLRAVKLRAESL